MTSDFKKQRIENWVSDFCTSDEIGSFPAAVKDVAAQVLLTFLAEASVNRGIEPEDMEEAHLKKSLLGPVAKLNVPEAARSSIASLCGAFLADLETQGRLGGGRLLGAYVRALKEAYVEAASGKIKPVVRPGSRIGRNDPCPCGSGKKYKKCCMRE